MRILGFCVVCVLVLLACGIRINAIINYNIVGNLGHITIKIFYIPIFNKDVVFYTNTTTPKEKLNKAIKIKINLSKQKIKYFQNLVSQIKSKIYLQSLQYYQIVGVQDNAYVTNMLVGYSQVLYTTMQSYISSTNIDAKYKYCIVPNYFENTCTICIDFVIYLSVFDVVWAIIVSLYKRRKVNG